jgi:phosphoglycerate dehydrogenase-like enzyme
MTVAVLPALLRPMVEMRLPGWIEPRWWASVEEMHAHAPEAEIGWFDMHEKPPFLEAVELARGLKWLNTLYAGVDFLPLEELAARGVTVTNGAGLTATQVAEFAVMTMLTVAKGYRAVARAQDRGEWLGAAPGIRQLAGSRALILGMGAIGRAMAKMLEGFGVEVAPVRRSPGAGELGPEDWKAQLGTFDWIVLALPGTGETVRLIGAEEFAAMKRDAVLINFARADILDQQALVAALKDKRIAAAVLDLTDPEPLPAGHELWSIENAHITMHLSGIPTPASMMRAADRFLVNCERWRAGDALESQVDLSNGY